MAIKRKQYYVNYYKFSNLNTNGTRLEFSKEDAIVYQNSENILYSTVYRLMDRSYDKTSKNFVNEVFVLNAENISTKEEDGQLERYKQLMSNGVYIDGVKYIRFGKSSSMAMNQRTLFVTEELHSLLKECISLSKQPEQTVISKYETALGLTLSSVNLIQGLPKIAIIPDFETTVTDDVKMVKKFTIDKSAPEYQEYLQVKEIEDKYKKKTDLLKELNPPSVIRQTPLSIDKTDKGKSAWIREGRRVKLDQLEKPRGYKVYKEKDIPYYVYSIDQTEEFPNLINKYSLGYEIQVVENHENKIEPFDGQGLISLQYAEKLSKKLKLGYVSNGFQIRLPYVKGLTISVDFKSWFSENGVTYITDIWNNLVDINEVDIILTESCFKTKMEATEGKSKQLFSSMEEYVSLLEEYGHEYIGIANHVKSHDETDIYTDLNYQFINSLNLSLKDLETLSKKPGKFYMSILNRGDTAAVKAFLNMMVKDDETYEMSRLDTDVQKAIELDARMIFDPRVQKYLRRQVQKAIEKLAIGRIPVKGNYKFTTGDIIAFLEFAAGFDEVEGFLNKDEYYCSGKLGEHVMMRNPLTSWHEVKKGNFVSYENRYVEHLNNVIQINTKDLTMPQLSGLDNDGDKILLTDSSIIRNAVIEDLVIVNDDDKTPGKTQSYGIDSILDFELRNLSNMTPIVTNIDTFIQSKALEVGDLKGSELAIATCKQLQAEFIDSVKKGTNPQIPSVLLEKQNFKPYFQKFIYEDMDNTTKDYKYLKINSPLNEFAYKIEERLGYLKEKKLFDSIGYLDKSTFDLIVDESKYDKATFFSLCEKIIPIYNEYAEKSGLIWKEQKAVKKVRASAVEKEVLKNIKMKYKELGNEVRAKLSAVCDNPSVLTSVCAYIEYHEAKIGTVKDKTVVRTANFLFPWICTKDAAGILENLKTNEEKNKIDVLEVKELNRKDKEFEGILIVKGGIASVDDQSFSTNLKDGRYRLQNQMGYHYIDYDKEREADIVSSESKSMKSSRDTELVILKDYKVRLHIGVKTGEEVQSLINDNQVELKKNGEYLRLVLGEDDICGIYNEYERDLSNRIFLSDYVGKKFNVKVEKVNNKSLTVSLDLVI